jgi:hypothetical protein
MHLSKTLALVLYCYSLQSSQIKKKMATAVSAPQTITLTIPGTLSTSSLVSVAMPF